MTFLIKSSACSKTPDNGNKIFDVTNYNEKNPKDIIIIKNYIAIIFELHTPKSQHAKTYMNVFP